MASWHNGKKARDGLGSSQMKQIICYTKFKLDPFSDGGSKRSVQIRALLEQNNIPYYDDSFALPKDVSNLQLAKWVVRAILFIHRNYPERILSLSKYFQLIKYYALRIPIVFDKYENQDVDFLWENTNDRKMLYLFKATGHRVIGMPHNIESLVNHNSIDALEAEVTNLKHCDIVFAISKEETWLLRLLGLNAHYLPYYPPEKVESFLLSIRQKRENREASPRKKYALLGSATNTPTRNGMQSLIDYAEVKKSLPFDLIVAGFGTESLLLPSHSKISLLGTLSDAKLEQLLVNIDAILIYQPPTTGALTRIPEMLIAGIPVIANFDAARNYYNYKGVHVYSTLDELFSFLSGFESYTIESSIGIIDNQAEFNLFRSLVLSLVKTPKQ